MSSQPQDEEVHITEIITPNPYPYSDFQVDIIIDIRPSPEDSTVVKNLNLILKCKKFVNWVIRSFDVKGNLKVIAPNSIGFGKENERSMTMTRSIRNDIPSNQENLVKWALDNGYGPVTSYTLAPVANRNNEEVHTIPPGLQILLDPVILPGCTEKEKDHQKLPKCVPRDEACTSLDAAMIWAMMQNKKTFTKPLAVIHQAEPKEKVPSMKESNPVPPPIFHGLDTLTVTALHSQHL
ncbi:TGF-beta receptor type III [Heterocephalus glaber]|uniref:TGF-beta receptor type III n=1 Tax=Heterocephalus glaber TaxID=10181 RepID=G5BTL9_HETGA|nr:TGF-beta receptor type III [Heterocephalus glaber]